MDSTNGCSNSVNRDEQIHVMLSGNAWTGWGSVLLFIAFLIAVISFLLGHHIGYHFGSLEERLLFSESYAAGEIIYTDDFKERMYGRKERSDNRNAKSSEDKRK